MIERDTACGRESMCVCVWKSDMIKFTSFFAALIWRFGVFSSFFFRLSHFLVTSNTRIFGQSEQLHRNTDDALKEHNANIFLYPQF